MATKNKNPEVRFKGFAEDWENKELRENATFNPKAELPENFEYVDLESVSGTEMISHRKERKSSAPSRAQRLARYGDVFYQTVRPYQKNNYLFDSLKDNFVFSTGYAQMRPIGNSYFLFSLIQSDEFVKIVLDNCTGTSYPAINSNDLASIRRYFPQLEEQKQIGTFFQNLDKLITQHQKKYDKLVILKKTMLEKMFPKTGDVVPEIRFKGFTKNWVKKKLGNTIVDIVDNRGKNPKYYCEKGIPIIDNFMIKNNLYLNLNEATRFIDEDLYESFIRKYNEVNDVLITLVGNSIGNITLFPEKKSVIIQNTLGLRFGNDKVFMFFYLLCLNKTLKNLNRGMAQPSIRQDELLGIDITTPINPDEEQKIGEYFKNLDKQITLHQTQLDKLKNIKKACLSKMFVAQE